MHNHTIWYGCHEAENLSIPYGMDAKTNHPPKPTRLRKRDWLSAGINMMARQGAGAVRIDAICRELNVTKGSFYWHFKDRKDLLDGLFEYWENTETEGLISHVEAEFDNPKDRIWYVVRRVTVGDYDLTREIAVRHWANQDKSVEKRLKKVDAKRIDFFARQFTEFGFDAEQALFRAHTLYSVTLAQGYMHTRETVQVMEDRMRASVDFLFGEYLSPTGHRDGDK